MRKRVRGAMIFMFVMSVACTILATNVWRKDRSNDVPPSNLLLGFLFTLTAIFDAFQIYVLSQILIVLRRTKVNYWVSVSVVIVSCLICISFILSNTFADIDWMLLHNINYRKARIASEWL